MSVRNVTPTPEGMETYKTKFLRRFKEEPLVPLGAALTTVALATAIVKSRRGDQRSMNLWLRARVVFQGLTIVAIVGGSYAFGRTKQQKEAAAAAEQDALLSNAAKERAEFEVRLAAAEEAHRVEEALAQGRRTVAPSQGATSNGWGGWFGGGGKGAADAHPEPPKTSEALPTPPGVSSAPAGTELLRSPVAEASTSSNKGFWERLGFGGSSSSEKKP